MIFNIAEDVFNTNCAFHIGTKFESTKKLIEKLKHPDEKIEWESLRAVNGFSVTTRLKDGATAHLIWLEKFEWNARDLAIAMHELIHLVMHILNHKGIPIRLENDEVFAYLFEKYSYDMFCKLRKLKKKK